MYTVAGKLLLYPTVVSAYCGRNLLIPAFCDFLLEGLLVFAISYLCSRKNGTIFDILRGSLGDIPARIILGVLGLYYFSIAIIPVLEQKLYVHAIFYDNVSSILVFIPIFVFLFFAVYKGFESIGRSADICLPIFLVSIVAIFSMSAFKADYTNLLPLFSMSWGDFFKGATRPLFRFTSAVFMLMFLGRFECRRGDVIKITFSYLGGALLVLCFLGIFYGMYGGIAQSVQFAIAKTSLFFPAIDIVGRIDLVALYALEIIMLFALAMPLQLSAECFKECLQLKMDIALSIAVNLSMLLIVFSLDNSFDCIHRFFGNWMWIGFVAFSVVLPLLLILLGVGKYGKKSG
jgi:hypothetical protein